MTQGLCGSKRGNDTILGGHNAMPDQFKFDKNLLSLHLEGKQIKMHHFLLLKSTKWKESLLD